MKDQEGQEKDLNQEKSRAEAPIAPDEVSAVDGGDESSEQAEEAVAELVDELEETVTDVAAEEDSCAQEVASLKDQLLRLRAEFDNYRKRSLKEQERIRATASEGLLQELLPVVDNLERAVQSAPENDSALAQGVEMVLRMFRDVLSGQGLEPVPGVGAPFDPNCHEALAQQPSEEIPADHVAVEYERGYLMRGYVLRHAKVVVSSGPAEETAEE